MGQRWDVIFESLTNVIFNGIKQLTWPRCEIYIHLKTGKYKSNLNLFTLKELIALLTKKLEVNQAYKTGEFYLLLNHEIHLDLGHVC